MVFSSKQGGLSLADLREKIAEYELDLGNKPSRKEMKVVLESLLPEDEDEEEDEEHVLTKDQVTIWFLPTTRGGLKINEIREKAKEWGIEIPKNAQRKKVEAHLLEHAK